MRPPQPWGPLKASCNESVMEVWLRLRHRRGEEAKSKRGGLKERQRPARKRHGPAVTAGGRSVARTGEDRQRAYPAGGALSGASGMQVRRGAFHHGGAETGTHHLGSRSATSLAGGLKSHPADRRARRSHSLARAARGAARSSAVERRGMRLQQNAVDRVGNRQRQDLGSGAPIGART